MKLVINSSLCCRFLYCMCNQMWPSLGFTAINELRECARGSKRPAAGLGSDSARPGAGHSAASDSLTGVSRALGPGVPTRPRAVPVCTATLRPKAPAPVRRDRWLSRSQESRLSGGPGLGGGWVRTFFSHPAPTVLKHLATASVAFHGADGGGAQYPRRSGPRGTSWEHLDGVTKLSMKEGQQIHPGR